MRILGLDYGAKRVGIALSDETGNVAFPYSVWSNDGSLFGKIKALCVEVGAGRVVIGDTLDYRGVANEITAQVNKFKLKLEKALALPVTFASEIFSSREANRVVKKDAETDARAAAIILQSYLDREIRK